MRKICIVVFDTTWNYENALEVYKVKIRSISLAFKQYYLICKDITI